MPFLAALVISFSAVLYQAVELPGRVVACSCAGPPRPLAQVAAETDAAIVVGTVGRALPDRTPVVIDSWFHGDDPTDVVWLSGGTQSGTSCDIFMSAGERRLLVLYPGGNGLHSANSCSPGGVLGTAEGDALLADAISVFGVPQLPPTPVPEPAAPLDLAPWLGGMGWVAAAAGAAFVLFGVIALLARRRPSD